MGEEGELSLASGGGVSGDCGELPDRLDLDDVFSSLETLLLDTEDVDSRDRVGRVGRVKWAETCLLLLLEEEVVSQRSEI